jgi:hypothetical protein
MIARFELALCATAIVILAPCIAAAIDADYPGNACGSCDGGFLNGELTSLIGSSDHDFDDFISPMTNPVFFEDPRTLTEARVIFMNHTIPRLTGVTTSSDSIQLYAVQVRAALTDELSFIATKDGYVVSGSPLLDDGWADVAAGLKYNLYSDTCNHRLLSAGLTYEMPVGSTQTLQGNGDGEFHLFLTGMTEFGDEWHWISGLGIRLPVDNSAENQVFYWSNHVDREIVNDVYFLGELNWYNWMSSATAFPLPIEGGDLINLGSAGVAGNNIVTAALGLKYKPSGNMELGIAFECPISNRRDLIENRLTADWILRY